MMEETKKNIHSKNSVGSENEIGHFYNNWEKKQKKVSTLLLKDSFSQ